MQQRRKRPHSVRSVAYTVFRFPTTSFGLFHQLACCDKQRPFGGFFNQGRHCLRPRYVDRVAALDFDDRRTGTLRHLPLGVGWNADVNAFERLQMVRGRNSSYFGSKHKSCTARARCLGASSLPSTNAS
jgi:hypothetical protein